MNRKWMLGLLVLGGLALRAVAWGASPFEGSWQGRSGDTRIEVTPLDELRLSVSGEIKLKGQDIAFQTIGTVEGETLVFEAPIASKGIVGGLLDVGSEKRTIRGRYKAGRDDAGDVLEGSWKLSKGGEGKEPLRRRGAGWQEKFLGGSPEAEAKLIERFTKEINDLQKENAGEGEIKRGFHAKGIGVRAELRVREDLPVDLRVAMFQPGARLPAIVRFSNASGKTQGDERRDLRGIAFRVKTGTARALLSGEVADAQDFLMTNFAASHARDPEQFMFVAGALQDPKTAFPKLVKKYGIGETLRIVGNLARGSGAPETYAGESYFSRAPIKWGPGLAVKFAVTPVGDAGKGRGAGEDRLRADLEARLREGEISFDFSVQVFVDEKTTPIEDGSVEWKTDKAPFVKVGTLVVSMQDLDAVDNVALASEVERLAFNPWHATEDFRPLGSLMRARREVYKSSATLRLCPFGFGR